MAWSDGRLARWVPQASMALLCGVMVQGASLAEKADKGAPMNVQADAMRHDEPKQTTELTGNVIITKGSIVMRGARIEVRVDGQGHQFAKIYSTSQNTAFFRQKREGMNEFIEGEAEEIVYDGAADTVTLSARSTLRRFAGVTLMDEMKGSKIVYDNATERYSVDSGPSNVSAINPSGRVTAVIAAKPKNAASAAVAPASGTSPALRTTTRIGEKSK